MLFGLDAEKLTKRKSGAISAMNQKVLLYLDQLHLVLIQKLFTMSYTESYHKAEGM